MVLVALSGCSLQRERDLYVLGGDPPIRSQFVSVLNRPIVRIERVGFPDYLDTTDIIAQDGDRVVASVTGRWADPLSKEATRAVAQSLTTQLPYVLVTIWEQVERPSFTLDINIDTFERESAECVLSGRWTITGKDGNQLAKEDFMIVTPIKDSHDATVAAAMTEDLDQLTKRIAAVLRGLVPPGPV